MLRDTYTLDPASGAVLNRQVFSEQPWIDRVANVGVSWHEGQLFGIFNQIIGLFTAFGAATLAISAVVMWWRRRPAGVLGAPAALASPSLAPALVVVAMLLALISRCWAFPESACFSRSGWHFGACPASGIGLVCNLSDVYLPVWLSGPPKGNQSGPGRSRRSRERAKKFASSPVRNERGIRSKRPRAV